MDEWMPCTCDQPFEMNQERVLFRLPLRPIGVGDDLVECPDWFTHALFEALQGASNGAKIRGLRAANDHSDGRFAETRYFRERNDERNELEAITVPLVRNVRS